ncbi:hypothetical protein APY04_2688 [Hyphomicrobium sulfonivorans]|uniref:Beta-lactamase class A catalytic domain-containing protein n=1 Tax=Hyphomicrobium sulfonivorans TaxID=121290 RepID=A0A109BBS2_HYPSL|nr:serine hydrolase [Hyphomicrobium sulfonivorans]KWT65841.1 hypothetical protein APY04_2688 [Hyphomicrobium sulfonivorans]
MRRRQFLSSAVGAAAIAALSDTGASAASVVGSAGGGAIPHVLAPFLALPGVKGAQIDVDHADQPWRASYNADAALFCGSCFKTFVLAAYLQELEAGRQDEAEQLGIDDSNRTLSGPVYEHVSGAIAARYVLEAMIAHSDNTATDAIMNRVGTERVRKFIAEAGLKDVRIPDSTRKFFSYLTGAQPGADLGWKALSEIVQNDKGDTSKYRPALNDVSTMATPASQLVDYYKRVLSGAFFKQPETLAEFRRISAMADGIVASVPAGTAAYGKGGSIDWNGFHCMAIGGQMMVRAVPVTFSFIVNWNDADGPQDKTVAAYVKSVASVLTKVHDKITQAQS